MPEIVEVKLEKQKKQKKSSPARNKQRRSNRNAQQQVNKAIVALPAGTVTSLPGNRPLRAAARKAGVGLTPLGRRWLERVCNPCATDCVAYGVPDFLSANVCTPQERQFHDIAPKFGVSGVDLGFADATPWSDGDPWNMIVITDGAVGMFFTYQWQSATQFYIGSIIPRLTEHVSGVDNNFTSSRLMYLGTTLEFTGPSIEDQGELTAAQLRPNYRIVRQALEETEDPYFRRNYITWEFAGTTGESESLQLVHERLIQFIDELPEADSMSQGWKVKNGAYMIHKIDKPVIDMVDHNEPDITPQTSASPAVTTIINPFGFLYTYLSFGQQLMVSHVTASQRYAFNSGVVAMTGMSPRATFRLKSYIGYEATILPKSEFRYYAHPSPSQDHQAIGVAHSVLSAMPSAFPSDANAFGWLKKIWNTVKKPLSNMLPTIGGAIGNAFLPGVGGSLGSELGSRIGGWLK